VKFPEPLIFSVHTQSKSLANDPTQSLSLITGVSHLIRKEECERTENHTWYWLCLLSLVAHWGGIPRSVLTMHNSFPTGVFASLSDCWHSLQVPGLMPESLTE
jgi:hypothetical protein